MDVVFTIVSRNYAAQAATLMASLAAAEPSVRRVVVATDGPIAFADPGIEVLDAAGLAPDFAGMTAWYDALELNTAVKPSAFRALLARPGVTAAVYLDPDIFVYRPLDEVRSGLARAPLVLTPHITRPLAGEANPNDHVILTSGAYNLGFMAARNEPQIEALLDWWAGKLKFDCRVDFANGLFTDQKWMDLAPGFVSDLALVRTPALNLAYWNLEGRRLERAADGWRVDGEPLGFFHFSGFDPSRPAVLSKHQDRIRIEEGSPLAALCADYAQAMLANGHAQASATPYGHRLLPSGRPIAAAERRRVLVAARAGEDFSGGLDARTEAWLGAGDGVVRDPLAVAQDGPWLAGSAELSRWLAEGPGRAEAAMLAARRDLRDRYADDPATLRAVLAGPESLAGRFDPRLLGPLDADLARRAAARLTPGSRDLDLAAFGLAARAGWAANPFANLAAPAAFPRLFQQVWDGRGDLQKLFPLDSVRSRFAYLRWLAGGGLAELGIEAGDLPRAIRDRPLWRLAALSARPPQPLPRRPTSVGSASKLRVLETWTAEAAVGAEIVFEASSGRTRNAAGAPVRLPARVSQLEVATAAGLVPADVIALLAHGVAWTSAGRP